MKTKYAFALAMFGSFCTWGHSGSIPSRASKASCLRQLPKSSSQIRRRTPKEFLPPVRKTIADAGGKFLAAGGKTVSMEGAAPAPRIHYSSMG